MPFVHIRLVVPVRELVPEIDNVRVIAHGRASQVVLTAPTLHTVYVCGSEGRLSR
jgi:hypothetical protein